MQILLYGQMDRDPALFFYLPIEEQNPKKKKSD